MVQSLSHHIRAVSASLRRFSRVERPLSSSRRLFEGLHRTRRFSSADVVTTGNATPEVRTSKDGVVARPIDFDVGSKVEGNESQILTVALEPGQVLRAESGAMMYMTDGVQMNTTSGGGLSSGFQRMLTGQNFFISDYSYEGEPGTVGHVALGTDFPSKIVRLTLEEYGGKIVCQKGALLCASHTVDIQMEYSKNMSTGFFGGEGFVLQGLSGEGDVFVKAGGTLIRRDLKEGEQLRISSGCLVAFTNGVDYGLSFFVLAFIFFCWRRFILIRNVFFVDVQMVKGFANVFAGGEGLFMTTLTGPGVVWLQGQPAQRMISEIARRVPSGGGISLGIPIGGAGTSGGGDESSGDENNNGQ